PYTVGSPSTATGTITNDDCSTSFIVNNNGDAGDANLGDGICETATGNGVCTLRAAIHEANAALNSCGAININFNVGSSNIALTGGELPSNHSLNINVPSGNSVMVSGHIDRRLLTGNSGNT